MRVRPTMSTTTGTDDGGDGGRIWPSENRQVSSFRVTTEGRRSKLKWYISFKAGVEIRGEDWRKLK